MYLKILDLDGKVAVDWLTIIDQDQPISHHYYKVSNLRSQNWSDLIGREVALYSHQVYLGNGRYTVVDYTDWPQICIDSAIPKPRNGKEYTWKWVRGKWEREEFPKCSWCYKWHDPAFPQCEKCGYCHRPGNKCKV